LAAEIDYRLALLGADKNAFDTIVAGGPRSALPHAAPGPHRLPLNSLIVIDQGAILDGYTSDMTRTICLGHVSPRELEMFRAVGEAQQAAIAAVKPGAKAASIDRKARQVLRKFKLENAFLHSTGHGLGIEIHERPRLGPGEDARLAAGMVVTIEPGVYLPGVGGVRIEDVVVVTRSGCEVLTQAPKQLQIALGV
jgi:Xaa-Pro aminopeptidase